jgi:hypothetical protein
MKTLAYRGWRMVNGRKRFVTINFLGGHSFEFKIGFIMPQTQVAHYMCDGSFNDFADATLTWM